MISFKRFREDGQRKIKLGVIDQRREVKVKRGIQMFDLTGKTAIVTGASQGIGRSIALALADFGADIIIADVADGQEVVSEIEDRGGQALFVKTDVSNNDDVEEMVKKTIDRFGKIDILVNNAGIVQRVKGTDTILGVTEESFDRVMDVNAKGAFLCAKAVFKEMIKRKSGRIVNITSIGAKWGGVGMGAAYGASKAALACLTKSMAIQGAPHGIIVNAVAPHAVAGGMSLDHPQEVLERIAQQTLLGRMGEPEEIANVVIFLVSDAATFITGQVIHVNGGTLMID